ncbi:MAG: YvrJ family protein [Tissierellia bacterium]|nr:YvrJ family protein [Tissierellia bacterium]
MAEILETIGNQAFPIVVSIYLLTRFEGRIDALRTAIEELNRTIASNTDRT